MYTVIVQLTIILKCDTPNTQQHPTSHVRETDDDYYIFETEKILLP